MKTSWRWIVGVIAIALAVLVGWQVIATGTADRLASKSPRRALAWDPHDPAALLALARQQLAAKNPDAAAASARALLRHAPLTGEAFVVLAQAADARGDAVTAQRLYAIALRRAPRDLPTRMRVISDQLREGRYAAALDNVNILLRISPALQGKLFPVMARLTAVPAFATALLHTLETEPDWTSQMLAALLESGSHDQYDRVFSRLADAGQLSNQEADQWLDHLMREGRWGEAYSRWAGRLDLPPGTPLPAVYDGGFETVASGVGFDWQMSGGVGVIVERVASNATRSGYAAEVTFLDRRVTDAQFEQTLLLEPGTYRLRFRARAQALLSDKGVQWAVSCLPGQALLAASPLLEGSFDWQAFDTHFTVPSSDCPAQRLWLRNPGADGAGKIVSGELWVGDFAITPATHRGDGGPDYLPAARLE